MLSSKYWEMQHGHKGISQCLVKQLTAFILKSHSTDTITTMYHSISFLSRKDEDESANQGNRNPVLELGICLMPSLRQVEELPYGDTSAKQFFSDLMLNRSKSFPLSWSLNSLDSPGSRERPSQWLCTRPTGLIFKICILMETSDFPSIFFSTEPEKSGAKLAAVNTAN